MTVSKISTEPHAQGEIEVFRLANAAGAYVDVCNIGAGITAVVVPDREGRMADVALGYRAYADYVGDGACFGKTPGRFANRIAGGRFTLDGKEYRLAVNNGPNHLHGGPTGFANRLWQGETTGDGVAFTRTSPDGEEGYPGNLACTVTYWWAKDDVCRIEYEAETDRPTVVNLSNHTYFNLKGQNGGYVMDHVMQVEADRYFRNTAQYVPDGAMLPVEDTPFDMRAPHRIDYAIDTPDPQLQIMRGFSVCWVLRSQTGELARAADLYSPRSGRGVETWTTEPGLLTYTGRGLNERMIGKNGVPLEKFGGMLLETLHFADSPNRPDFPSTVLRPGERYRSVTEFRFYAK